MENSTPAPKGRRDAVRIKDIDPFHSIVPYVMPKRTEAEVFDHESIDVTDLLDFIKKEKEEGGAELKLFHAVCTAVAKTLYFRPLLNSFVSGRRFWQRREILLSFVAKKRFEDHAEEGLMTLKVDPDYTLFDIAKKIIGDVQKVRKEGTNDLDGLMSFVGKLPRFALTALFFFIRRMEYHGCVPKALTDGDPNYTSVLLSNLGSIKCGAPYHHLSNYGTNSVMMTIGVIHKEQVVDAEGNTRVRDMVDVGITLDERIADGFYFARSIKLFKHLVEHPETLLLRISEPVDFEPCELSAATV